MTNTERRELVKTMFQSGKTPQEITEATGYKWNTIKGILNKSGISYAPRCKYDYSKVKEMKESGMSIKEISQITNIPKASISKWLSSHGMGVVVPPVTSSHIDINKLQYARPRRSRIEVVNGKKYVDITETLFNQPYVGEEVSLCMKN